MTTAALVLVAVLVGLLLLLLVLPLRVHAHGMAGDEELWGSAELRWGPSLVMLRFHSDRGIHIKLLGIPVYRADSFPSRSKKKKGKKPKKEKARKKRSLRESLESFAEDRHLLFDMAARALRALHASLYIGGRMGLADPSKTALALASIRELDRRLPEAIELDLWDDYIEDTLQLEGRLKAWLVPLEAVLIALGWLIRADSRRVLLGRSAKPAGGA